MKPSSISLARVHHRRGVAEREAELGAQPLRQRQVGRPLGLPEVGVHRLLAQHVLTGLECGVRGLEVRLIAGRDVNDVDVRVAQHVAVVGVEPFDAELLAGVASAPESTSTMATTSTRSSRCHPGMCARQAHRPRRPCPPATCRYSLRPHFATSVPARAGSGSASRLSPVDNVHLGAPPAGMSSAPDHFFGSVAVNRAEARCASAFPPETG